MPKIKKSKKNNEHPMQPVYIDDNNVARFKSNCIVRYMLDAGKIDMNMIAALPNIPKEDREQFAQLIGYSVDGFGELSYVSDEAYAKASKLVEEAEASS